ncbi:Uu.00g069780.m01.CDS01 [Anthostomella pinea]|uniref:Uu.00g069780.m01.CDS01 n=1 Tax=Anthostomella pinea TaxID=933095 RepID=A0AAI8VVS6_9PEZI|nr:Uu.00g069780.m01.CDS01 [Anthostomella pinea]
MLSSSKNRFSRLTTFIYISCALAFFFLTLHSLRRTYLVDPSSALGQFRAQKPPQTIPEKIWYKLGPKGMTEEVATWMQTCIEKNPSYEAHFLTDDPGDAYVRETFAHSPDIVEIYLGLSVPILKADLLRYLLLYADGGVWFDLDVSCEGTPIANWVPELYRQKAGLVVGWEFDVGWGKDGEFQHQFASWTIMARPHSPHMMVVIQDILQGVRDKMAEHQLGSIPDLELSMVGDVVDFTGPRRFTRGVMKSLERHQWALNGAVDHDGLYQILEPRTVGDVLVLPGYSFALSMNKYEEISEKGEPGPPLVTHHYAGTWKNDRGGE